MPCNVHIQFLTPGPHQSRLQKFNSFQLFLAGCVMALVVGPSSTVNVLIKNRTITAQVADCVNLYENEA